MTGLTLSSVAGYCDCNEMSWSHVINRVSVLVESSGRPVLVDGDSGFGNFRLLARRLSVLGVAGVAVEDKLFPKLSSLAQSRQHLETVRSFCGKIRTGLDACLNPSLLIVAHVEALVARSMKSSTSWIIESSPMPSAVTDNASPATAIADLGVTERAASTDRDFDEFLAKAGTFLEERRADWDLAAASDIHLEVFNHVMRVWIQGGSVADHLATLRMLLGAQRPDGGWGDTRDEARSKVRSTAFATQMLMRCDRVLKTNQFQNAIRNGVLFLLDTQRPDGSWDDHKWHYLDATSVSVGTLLFAVREPWATSAETEALRHGITFILAEQKKDGLWYHKARSSPVEITAHFLQKVIPYGVDGSRIAPALEGLLGRQHPEGHWDRENVDSTCDAARALMLGARSPAGAPLEARIAAAVSAAITWLLCVAASGSVGAKPGHSPEVLYTTDVIDTVCKYRQFAQSSGPLLENYQ